MGSIWLIARKRLTNGVDVPYSEKRNRESDYNAWRSCAHRDPHQTSRATSRESIARPRARLPGPVHGRARRDHRERRAADPAARPALLAELAPVGDQLLHPGLRRLPAARREGVGSLRAQAPVPRRSRRVHGGLGAGWHRAVVGIPDRGARPAGVRRCARLAGGALDRHYHLPRGPRAHPRDGRLGGDRRRWRGGRPAARRDPDRVRVVALDLLHQRPRRSARVRARDALRARVAPRGASWIRSRRRAQRDRRADRPRLRDRQGAGLRLGLGADDRPARRGGRPARDVRRHRAALAPSARPARHLPDAVADRGEHRDAGGRRRDVRDLLLRHAVRAGDPAPLAGPGGPRLSSR